MRDTKGIWEYKLGIMHHKYRSYQFMNIIAYTTLDDLTLKTEIQYDHDPLTTVVDDDKEF